jgi:signal transduction histidine kinase
MIVKMFERHMEAATGVLIVAPHGQDAILAAKVLASADIVSEIIHSFEELAVRLTEPAGLLLIAEEAITPFALELISSTLAKQETWSDLPIILLTQENRRFNRTKKIVEHFGNVANISLLERPFSIMTLITMVKVAIRARIKQYHVRALLDSQQKALNIRDEFLSIASHELKTPITTIKLQTQMKRRRINKNDLSIYSPPKVNEFIDVIDLQTTRIARLVDDMLDITRIDNGKLSIRTEHCNLGQIVKDILAAFTAEVKIAKSQITYDIKDSITGFWDRYRIEQVIINLLTNAMKYGDAKPIHVKVYQEEDRAIFQVTDQGIGIPKLDIHRIFERFERAVSGGNISGLGLGLYISKEIINRHGGELSVESILGQGSTFKVMLPADAKGK